MTAPSLIEQNPRLTEELRAAGATITTDEDLVAAFANRYGASRDTARLVLARSDDVVTQ